MEGVEVVAMLLAYTQYTIIVHAVAQPFLHCKLIKHNTVQAPLSWWTLIYHCHHVILKCVVI